MAANRFATTLQKNTNKITLILVYAVLEWILIVLLLFNSLFSYLIIRFADYFGLKPPCPWCARIDRIFTHERGDNSVCAFHAEEISRLGYCASHRKLVESGSMCGNCLSEEFQVFSNYFSRFQNDEGLMVGESLRCACCGLGLDNTLYSSCMLLKTFSSWDVYECVGKENLITKARGIYDCDYSANSDAELCAGEKISQLDQNAEVTGIGGEENCFQWVPVDEMKELEAGEDEKENEVLEMDVGVQVENDHGKPNSVMEDKSVQAYIKEDSSQDISTHHLEFFLDYTGCKLVPVELIDSVTEDSEMIRNVQTEARELVKDGYDSKDCEVEVGENADDLNLVLDVDLNLETECTMLESMEMEEEMNSFVFHAKDSRLMMCEFQKSNNFPPDNFVSEDVKEVQEMDGSAGEMHYDIYPVRKTEESCEQTTKEAVAIEQLKSAIRDERETLEALYVELAEERSASEVAADQAMAMINRLQEEKAAIQMEAFQYQRMLEEQSEYDQEALELLNNLIVRREKEKQELEIELKACKQKVLDYETKEKMRVLRKCNGSTINGVSSGFCSNAEDCDRCVSSELHLDNFENERLSIIEQLQVLEEKLLTLDDNSEKQFIGDENAYFNRHHKNIRTGGWKEKFPTVNTKLGIEEEIYLVHERLDGLEADREFFKHCVNSLRKGEKGMELLQEIVQHLRDLQHTELYVRNYMKICDPL
ncbi:Myosin-binding protein 2 [Striga hermonthica]|uniref:Myosin-binding protein 2 n=1 Tax=Striga hermonthica TaxID=68872 RepID=A0A9N7NLJ2_STRHE|nr:Myosin-binding protein 2 [Striga hermonthica]